MARLIGRLVPWLIAAGLMAAGYILSRDYVRRYPQNVPWTPLRLDDPVGTFTLRKLVSLADDPAHCRTLLRDAGSADVAAPDRIVSLECGYEDGMRLAPAAGEAALAPAGVVTRCGVAAALAIWERQVVQPAAERHFGARLRTIDHA